MRFLTALLATGLLAGAVFAESAPPADPAQPGDPPKEEPPAPTTNWANNWQAARNAAQKVNGYALMWITLDPLNGTDAPHTSRLLSMYFGRPDVYAILNAQFGCWKGTLKEAQQQGGKHLQDAGVKEAPAVLYVDPENGEVVDCYLGRFTYQEIGEVTEAVMNGLSRKKLEDRMNDKEDKEAKKDPHLNYLYGSALLRMGDTKKARAAFEIGATGKEMKDRLQSEVGIAWCDLLEKKYKDAIEKSQKAMDQMPPMVDPRGTCLYIQVYAYYEQNQPDDAARIASTLRETLIRTTHGWKLMDDITDTGYCFLCKAKFAVGSNHRCPQDEPEQPK